MNFLQLNLVPPITDPSSMITYMHELQPFSPHTTFLPTLYLHHSLTPSILNYTKILGVISVKSYPCGLTMNSTDGVLSYEPFYDLFQTMSDLDLVLNLHGEC